MTISLLPIGTEPLQVQFQDAAGQIGNMIGLRNKESAVIDDQRQASLFLPVCPANPLLPQLELISARAPDQQRDPLSLEFCDITELLSYKVRRVQIVALDEDLIKALTFRRFYNQAQLCAKQQCLL